MLSFCKKIKKSFFGQNSKSWFVYFTNQEIPQDRFFFGEKATLKESYEPSLGKLRWPAFFMTVYPTVQSESCDPVSSIEKSNLFGKSSPHFFVKSQPFSYQLVLNPHTVKTKGKTSMKYFQPLKCEPSLLILREKKEGILYLVFCPRIFLKYFFIRATRI